MTAEKLRVNHLIVLRRADSLPRRASGGGRGIEQ